ncbi:hypothetical protein [Streptomyces sp. NRRL B-24484]|uniref:hypothetical protein n=1 Tax=Streptomyces sp. NRRL B-24484 TaxID=1463833 RepID=UPI000693518D|nr:hypothetical protein [Streptomyces sp. NRRL B-24484]
MNDGSETTPESGGQQQPQNPAAPPSQGAVPDAAFPPHLARQPAYGYPPPQDPGQPGFSYGYPQGVGGYGYPNAAGPAEPDWQQMADRNEQAQRKRKRLFVIGGSVLAAAAVAAAVTTAVLMSGNDAGTGSSDQASPSASASDASPSASLAPPTTPLELLSDARLDKSPVTVNVLYPAPTLSVQGRLYTLLGTELDKGCKVAPVNGLEQTVSALGCYNVYRATYVNDSHVQITVGIATFASAARATKAKSGTKGNVAPLVKDRAKDFCKSGVKCATTQSSLGRYAYYTIAGPDDGSAVAAGDKVAIQAARDISGSVYETLLERGRTGMAKFN